MLRIPNPGSDIDGFIRIFREIHPLLEYKVGFGIDDISKALVATNNVTAQGAIGQEALRRSTRKNRSLDPIYNQSKMYSELYRSHGWLQSTDSSLIFCVTMLGHHMATAVDPRALMKECLLGMAFPNEVLNVKGDQTLRVFGTILQAIAALGDLSRDEMIAGPMSIPSDSRPELIDAMIQDLSRLRAQKGALDKRLNKISRQRQIKRGSTMGNYTRYPMAALTWAGWATKTKPGVLKVTDEGRKVAKRIRASRDFRVTDFHALAGPVKRPLIVSTSYRMLERAGFDLETVSGILVQEEETLYGAGIPNGVMFSPFQQLSRQTITAHAPEMVSTEGVDAASSEEALAIRGLVEARTTPFTLLVQVGLEDFVAPDRTKQAVNLLKEALAKTGGRIHDAVERVAQRFKMANKDAFYPLVADLFTVLGFECRMSRAGVNYARADAMIVDSDATIPVEIKSPGEELEISVKGVRQALENKIILLARRTYKTQFNTTSLVIGFNPPNERSEVHELLEDIYRTFGVNIAVMDFRTLLDLALQCVVLDRRIVIPGFQTMRGLIRVEVAPPNR